MILYIEDEHDAGVLRRVEEATLPVEIVRAVAVDAQCAHEYAHQPGGLLHVSLTVVEVEQMPVAVLALPHGAVGAQVGFPGLAGQIEGMEPVFLHGAQEAIHGQKAALIGPVQERRLQAQGIPHQLRAGAGHLQGRLGAELVQRGVLGDGLGTPFPIPEHLLPERGRVRGPEHVMGRLMRSLHPLGGKDACAVVGKLLAGPLILSLAIEKSALVIGAEAGCGHRGVVLAIVAGAVVHQVRLGIGVAVLPEGGDVGEGVDMGLDVGAVDDPVVLHAQRKRLAQLLAYKIRGIGQHGHVAGGLQIIEGGVIVQPVAATLSGDGQGTDAGIVIALAAGDHLAVAVVGPDGDHILRQAQMALLVELHGFAVEIGAAHGLRQAGFEQVVLLENQLGEELAPGLRRVVAGIIGPEGLIALAAETDIPDRRMGRLQVNSVLPQALEEIGMLGIGGRQIGIGAQEHLRSQGFGVMMGDVQAEIGGQGAVAMGVLVRAGHHEIAAQAQKGFEGHLPGLVLAAMELPGVQEHFVVDEPAAVAHGIGRRIGGVVRGDLSTFLGAQRLIIPEPERLHAQQIMADAVQTINKSQIIPGPQDERAFFLADGVVLRRHIRRDQANGCAAGTLRQASAADVPLQGQSGPEHRP